MSGIVLGMTSVADYSGFAHAYLPQPLAQQWINLLLPAVEFANNLTDGETVALHEGGQPLLPHEVHWPHRDGFGPLEFIAQMDCAAVAATGAVDLLPTGGYLLFFMTGEFSARPADAEQDFSSATYSDRGVVIHVADGVARQPRPSPDGLQPREVWQRPARPRTTPPEVIALDEARFGEDVAPELWSAEFEDGIGALEGSYSQTEGWPRSVQWPVQLEAACARLGLSRGDTSVPTLQDAGHWRVLLQTVDARGDGCTVLYWMIRDDDLAARRFDRVWFTKQR